MFTIKIKYKYFFKTIILALLIFLFYTVAMVYILGEKSSTLKKEFANRHLAGESVDVLVKSFGEPQKITYQRNVVQAKSGNYIPRGRYYSILTYNTDNNVLNWIGYFPGGGTNIYVDQNDVVTRIESYLE
jgi:hypothetical protein